LAGPNRRGRCAIRKLFDIRSTAFLLALASVVLAAASAGVGNRVPDAGLPVADSRLAVTRGRTFYPMGWWDHLNSPDRLAGMHSESMNTVMPYAGSNGNVRAYLDQARRQGMKVFVQIDPLALVPPNPVLVRQFVDTYRKHPAVYGWLLADEPTLHVKYTAFTPDTAKMLYKQIKSVDPRHPVGIAFGVTEDPRPFVNSMDVLLYDDYVQDKGKPEFFGLWRWRKRLQERAAMARKLDGYMPILQGFGEDANGKHFLDKRLPTTKELRYITFTSIQNDATGLFFWVRYRSRKDWIDRVLTPLVKEIVPARRALAAGPISGTRVLKGTALRSTLFRDARSGARYLVVVHNEAGTTRAEIKIDPKLKVDRASAKDGSVDISNGKLVAGFGSYAARLYRLS
jgi:hypothetical protein